MLLNQHRLNTTLLNVQGGGALPQPAVTLSAPALVARLSWGAAQVAVGAAPSPVQVLEPVALVERMRWGQPALQLVLAVSGLKGARLGGATASIQARAAALVRMLRFGAASVQAQVSTVPLVARLQWGTPQASMAQSAQSLVARLSWGASALAAVLHAPSLRGGRLGTPAVTAVTALQVVQGLGPMRWGAHCLQVGGNPLPLSVRTHWGRPVAYWGHACNC